MATLVGILSILAMAPVVPQLERYDDLLGGAPAPSSAALAENFRRTGVLVSVKQLDDAGVPATVPLAERGEICGVKKWEPEPFEKDVRVVSECTGYFVTDQLFLTAAHCLALLIDDEKLEDLRIGRDYTSPTASIETYRIGRAVYASKLDLKGKEGDWVLLEACSKGGGCEDLKMLKKLVARARRSLEAKRPRKDARLKGYMISSPHGFHLHLARGTYQQSPSTLLSPHTIPAWYRSSGGAIFDQETHDLVGIQQGIDEAYNQPYCLADCVVRYSIPREDQVYRYVPLHIIKKDLAKPEYMNPRDQQDRELFKNRLDAAMEEDGLSLISKLKAQRATDGCFGCNGCD